MQSNIDHSALKWQASLNQRDQARLTEFMRLCGLEDAQNLWRWSIDNKEIFWNKVWDYAGIIGEKGESVFVPGEEFQSCRFFPDGRLNFAQNLLRRRDDGTAIVFRGEDKVERRLSFKQLYDDVSRLRQALVDLGVGKGDRVAGYLPNMPETIIAMLATASLGAIWSSASPDFGVQGVLDRFGQIEPKVLFAVDGYWYNGKQIDCRDKVSAISNALPSLIKTVVVDYLYQGNKDSYDEWVAAYQPSEITFELFNFNHPLYIMFSSGTTGIPKCIVHGAGGTLIQHVKEHALHCDIKHDDRVFYFSTCGWMMWNWLVSALAQQATVMLYDGSPFYPDGNALFEYAAREGITFFGTSAKFIDALRVGQYNNIGTDHDLKALRTIASTGSPLVHESFDYIYDHVKSDVHLASISGGTDIVSCFVLGNPLLPVWRGEIQGPGLGMDVDVFDEHGQPLSSGKGELVCKTAFPSMPIGFWDDPQGEKYAKAYFGRFPGVWCHGDWCEWTAQGGMIIYGRSDATLNPGGVRIGTAEIYRVVEQIEGIKESLAVGQEWENDVRVVLFVVMQPGAVLDEDLKTKIKQAVRQGASPRHVPARIVAVADIPRTKSGKITELAVRDVIHGRAIANIEALANPEALDFFKNRVELQE